MKKIFLSFLSLFMILLFVSCKGNNKVPFSTLVYGRYPKTRINDKEIIAKLDTFNDSNLNDDGYFVIDGVEYYKSTSGETTDVYTFEDGTHIRPNRAYYYLVEPISWRIMKSDDNYNYLITEQVIDCKKYVENKDDDISYDTSLARKFLINDFYSVAFTNENNKPEKTEINIVKTDGTEVTLNDEIWLPAADDMDNPALTFATEDDAYARSTDFTLSKAIPFNYDGPNSYYFKCSPFVTSTIADEDLHSMYYVSEIGLINGTNSVITLQNIGIRPCIRLKK